MDSDVSTSFRMPAELQEWLSRQARTRDSTAAVAATEGVGGPASWPPLVAPPLHQRVPIRGRPGRLRDRKGQFTS